MAVPDGHDGLRISGCAQLIRICGSAPLKSAARLHIRRAAIQASSIFAGGAARFYFWRQPPVKTAPLSRKYEQALLILTRNPELGKCKTRLAATIGDAAALAVYTFLLEHTARVTRSVEHTDKHVFYSERLGDGQIWEPAVFTGHLQQGADLGARIQNAFETAFAAGYRKVVLIGSDLYELYPADLAAAFASLDTHQAVVGPATDGGYYLMGLTRRVPALFRNKAWGTDTVLEATLQDLQGISTFLLPPRNDIDRYEDIAGDPVFAPFLKHLSDE